MHLQRHVFDPEVLQHCRASEMQPSCISVAPLWVIVVHVLCEQHTMRKLAHLLLHVSKELWQHVHNMPNREEHMAGGQSFPRSARLHLVRRHAKHLARID